MPASKLLNFYRVPAHFLSWQVALLLVCGELFFGILGFVLLEGFTLINAFYMVVITISTVGFAEVQELSDTGRLFTSYLIVANIGIFAYSLAVFSYYIVQGEIFKSMHTNQIRSRISKLNGHIVVCGYGKYGKEIAANLDLHQTEYVIIENSEERITQLRHNDEDLLYVEGDATSDDVLLEAGLDRAKGLICALGEDSENLFIVLSARELHPGLTIITRAIQERSQSKLKKAGADHVVMPENIGGFYMATLINKPGAVEFFSFITNEYQSDIGFEELCYKDLAQKYRGMPIYDLNLRSLTGVNIIGYRTKSGEYCVNPAPDTVLSEGDSFIILGSKEQLEKLRKLNQKLKA